MAEDAIARAKAIAAKLSSKTVTPVAAAAVAAVSELGKRKNRWDEDQGPSAYSHYAAPGLGLLQKKKIYIPVNEHPDVNFLGLLIGPRGRTQKELEQRTGTKIFIRGRGAHREPTGLPEDNDDLHVMIEGNGEGVDRAYKEIEEILFNPKQAERLKQEQLRSLNEMSVSNYEFQSKFSNATSEITTGEDGMSQVEVMVPNHLVGYLIGKGGESIQRMQIQTGVHCQIAKESDMKPGETLRSIVLRGPYDGVVEAKRRIEDTVKERLNYGKGTKDGKKELENFSFILKFPVPNDRVGIIIGKGGATVKAIQDKTGAHVHIPQSPDEDNPSLRTLSIGADSREGVETAQVEIVQAMQSTSNQPAANSIYITVPDERVGVIIGKGGVTIKDLQNRTNTKIFIPQASDPGSNPPTRTLTISGPPEYQYMAKFEIETIAGLLPGEGTPGGDYYGGGGYGDYGYGAAAYGAYDYSAAQQPYYGGATASASASTGQEATSSEATPTDPTAYYKDFWAYASYYGEAAARAYYTTWSPPEGTPPPEGITLPAAPAPATSEASQQGGQDANADPEAAAKAWEEYNKQYAEWMASQGAEQQQQQN